MHLAKRTHLVAVDLPGFGHSQRSDSLQSPSAMGEFIIAAADAFGPEHPHVVAPGTGTPAALFAAHEHPGRLRSWWWAALPPRFRSSSAGCSRTSQAPDLNGIRVPTRGSS